MKRLVADTLRAAADRVAQLPDHLPDPEVTVAGDRVHVSWRQATESTGRAVIELLPGEWHTSDSFMYRSDTGAVTMWWIYFARVEPVAVVSPAALLAEVSA